MEKHLPRKSATCRSSIPLFGLMVKVDNGGKMMDERKERVG